MSSKLERAGILTIAIVFIVSTIGIGIFYVLQAQKDNKDAQTQAEIQKNIQQQLNNQKTGETAVLKGTKLQNFTPVTASVTKLEVTDITPGTGAEVKAGDTVTVHYTGALAKDGTIFESSLDSGKTATFGLNQVIAGWTQGIPGMKEGGTRRLVIPAELAYGSSGAGSSIPPNSDLVFDVTLVKVGQ